jgi:hypothetical protein
MKVVLFCFLIFLFSGCESGQTTECKIGSTRCTGDKLESCSFYGGWDLVEDCELEGGTCVTSGSKSYCEDIKETPDSYHEWTEEPDKNKNDDDGNPGDPSNPFDDMDIPGSEDKDSEPDENYYPDEETDEFPDEYPDEDFDEEPDEHIPEPECGNGIVEEGEVCERGEVEECTAIDPELYSGGLTVCLDDCSGYNTVTCYKKD